MNPLRESFSLLTLLLKSSQEYKNGQYKTAAELKEDLKKRGIAREAR